MYFTIGEMCQSSVAKKYGIDNTPTREIEANLTMFINTVLDPIRSDWGEPITVSSGYRCPELNKKVGGAPTSGHQYGFCVDLQVRGGEVRLRKFAEFVYSWLLDYQMKWDELLFEQSGNTVWLHFCWIGKDGKQRMKRFDIVK